MTPDDHVIVLFGATGDLARRKLLPGLFRLAEAGLMPKRYRIVGTSRAPLDSEGFRQFARAAVDAFGPAVHNGSWDAFARTLSYSDADEEAPALAVAVDRAERDLGGAPRRLHYLSVPLAASAGIVRTLRRTGLVERSRMIMEKPFGTDLDSARSLNETVHAVFDESQVFRNDHFLGKETVENLLAARFGNGVFESIWNREHIDHVQIDVPETRSVGSRARFYEQTGAFRDMVVTHLLPVLGFVAMEPPTSFSTKALVEETVKVFDAVEPLRSEDIIRGQYAGYRREPGVAPDSNTETFVALRARVQNWRWAGVPFYLRTGKRLAEGRRLLTITFRDPPRRMFDGADGFAPNELVFDLGDRGAISTSFLPKCRARPCTCAGHACASTTTTPSGASTSSKPTSGSSTMRSSATARCSRARTASSGCGRSRRPCSGRRRRCASTSQARGARPEPMSSSLRGAGTCPSRPDAPRRGAPREPRSEQEGHDGAGRREQQRARVACLVPERAGKPRTGDHDGAHGDADRDAGVAEHQHDGRRDAGLVRAGAAQDHRVDPGQDEPPGQANGGAPEGQRESGVVNEG
jgi:glucose-6-phosphate 1-dehydrogenase